MASAAIFAIRKYQYGRAPASPLVTRAFVCATPENHQKPAIVNTATTQLTPTKPRNSGRTRCRTATTPTATGASSTSPYDRYNARPSKKPPAIACISPIRSWRLAATANAAIPHALTQRNHASAETATQIAAGATTRNGAARRASRSPATDRTVTSTAGIASAPVSTQNTAAGPAPDRPIRASDQNVNSAPGGWPATWVVHLRPSCP